MTRQMCLVFVSSLILTFDSTVQDDWISISEPTIIFYGPSEAEYDSLVRIDKRFEKIHIAYLHNANKISKTSFADFGLKSVITTARVITMTNSSGDVREFKRSSGPLVGMLVWRPDLAYYTISEIDTYEGWINEIKEALLLKNTDHLD